MVHVRTVKLSVPCYKGLSVCRESSTILSIVEYQALAMGPVQRCAVPLMVITDPSVVYSLIIGVVSAERLQSTTTSLRITVQDTVAVRCSPQAQGPRPKA